MPNYKNWKRNNTALKTRKLTQTKTLSGIKPVFSVILPSVEEHIGHVVGQLE